MSASTENRTLSRRESAGAPRLFDTRPKKFFAVLFIFAIVALPLNVSDTYVLTVLTGAGIAAIAATGLNVLTGYAGQISLGHAVFVGAGAFCGQYLGGELGLPFLLWLPLSALFAGAIGAAIAPFAMRLHGPYLAIVSFGLVFIGIYIARNLPAITGGLNGTVVTAPVSIGPLDFEALVVGPFLFSREQGMFLLSWLILAIVLLATANIVRSRSGRAMQAVRDHDLAAEVLGVRRLPTMMNAFVVSSALGGLAGGLLAVQLQYIRPENFGIPLSIEYLAIVVIGGLASVWGPVLGALFIALVPVLATSLAEHLPFIAEPGATHGITVTDFGLIIYGLLIVCFLLFRRRGLISLFPSAASQRPQNPSASPDIAEASGATPRNPHDNPDTAMKGQPS